MSSGPVSALPSTRLKSKQLAAASPDAAFELFGILVATAQTAICESISCRLSGASEKVKKQGINPNLSCPAVFLHFASTDNFLGPTRCCSGFGD